MLEFRTLLMSWFRAENVKRGFTLANWLACRDTNELWHDLQDGSARLVQ